MIGTVAGEEGNRNVVVLEDMDRCGGVSPGCERVDCCDRDEAIELLETSAADNSNVNEVCRVIRGAFGFDV